MTRGYGEADKLIFIHGDETCLIGTVFINPPQTPYIDERRVHEKLKQY